ncbi:hypothetical protein STEG23_033644, partial [Scotinomys teguina]
VSMANLLIDLSEQLLLIPFQKNDSWNFKTPAVVCPVQSPGNTTTNKKGSQQVLQQDTELAEVEDMLEMSLMALGEIHKAFCQQSLSPQSAVTLTSPVATLVLSSQNESSLPLSTYTLGDPAPLKLGFPSAEALKELLNKHPGVNLQVTGLAFNPFETSNDKNIVGSIGNVLLSSDYQLLQVRDLIEDIEIVLWRNASMETQPTNFNTSADRFTVTVNITSVEKTLIVTIEPESPLLMTLCLGFQDKPDHTHFYLNTSLPRDQVWEKDEEYTWVLTPESLQYGIGTYYIVVVVKVTVLADNDPSSAFHYLIQVYTGYRRRAATTAQVVITLYGSEGHSKPHHLCDPQRTVFERGALDVFLLSTGSWLGDLHGLRLWHDNSGNNPSC